MKPTASSQPVNRPSSGSNVSFKHPVSEVELAKAKAIAQAIGGTPSRTKRVLEQIVAVLATFGGTITHVEHPQPMTYAPGDYTQDPDTLSAQ